MTGPSPSSARAASPARRHLIKAAGAAVLGALPGIVRAQPLRKVRFGLPYVPQGSTLYPQVAQQGGIWRKRGLDVELFSHKGSFPALQGVASDKLDFAISQFPSLVLSAAKGLPLRGIAITSYTNGWAVGLRDDSSIRKPGDLAGRTVGRTLTTSDSIFLPEYLRRSGVDPESIKSVNFDNSTQAVINKLADANSTVIGSSAPVYLSQGTQPRYLPYGAVGLETYGHVLAVKSSLLDSDPELVRDITEGLLEGIKVALTEPGRALDLFFKAAPEVRLSSTGAEFTRIGLGLYQYIGDSAPARQHGLGSADAAALKEYSELIVKFLAEPNTPVPSIDQVFDLRYVGKTTLTAQQWAAAQQRAQPYAIYY
ncbi:ABC transporter substrate-binding protein [Bordetella sp. BOR01]|uniref:ABC transporter substrate-binding protein n=1 Tax=Bordetella sp. BOR01 TaxID=2854779 RepID=UPI001C442203|nr:ABC transporter substrate-binding protein [Bordetella sp. BOR01]MBV7481682.1 ABC transporter substrate-binding protein [Bordetella sp. BOR01]